MESKLFKRIYEENRLDSTSNEFNPADPITSIEDCEKALWYIEDQFHNISIAIDKYITSLVLSNTSLSRNPTKIQEAQDIQKGISVYASTAKEIRSCISNIRTTLASLRNFFQNGSRILTSDSPVFIFIEEWTHSVENKEKLYQKVVSKFPEGALPSISELVEDYSNGIREVNNLLKAHGIQELRLPNSV